ncbi:MAG: hypothetical protein ACO3VO_05280 [Ilumatobacteraceae bacterium]
MVESRVYLIETCINRGESRVNLFESFIDARESLIHLHSEEVDVILGGNVAPANGWEVCHENVGHIFRHETAQGLMEFQSIGLMRRHEFAFPDAVHTTVCARDAQVGGNSYVAWPAS